MTTWKTPQLKRLARALLSLRAEHDLMNFLRDVGTLEELGEWSRRWEAAQMIDRGVPYREVAKKTGLSTATVTRIAHWLRHGEGGYQIALRRRPKR